MESGPHQTRILRRHARDLTALLHRSALADVAVPHVRGLAAESGAIMVLLMRDGGADPVDGAGRPE